MNSGFYKDLDTNFQQACIMCEESYSHQVLISMLKDGNIPQKQYAALNLETVNDNNESKILVDNLTGCDGKIREAVALKINDLLPELADLFNYPEIFAAASIDINANICRLVIESVSYLKKDKEFSNKYINIILGYTNDALNELDKFIFKDKKYVINKQLFKLYWCLESIKLFYDEIDEDVLFEILCRASKEREYTIREKVAQILINIQNDKFNGISQTLMKDSNYYVRSVFN